MSFFNAQLERRFLKALRVKARSSPAVEALTMVAIAVVIYVSFLDINAGATTSSVQMTFFATLGLLGQAAGKIGRYYNASREGRAAMDRLDGIGVVLKKYDQTTLKSRLAETDKKAAYNVQKLSYRYPGQNELAVEGFSFSFQKGRSYCIVGASGAGKSTLMKILLGLLEPSEGRVVRDSAIAADQIGYLPQRPKIFPGSVAENVAYPKVDIDEDQLRAALSCVNLIDWSQSLEDGVSTTIGKHGREVSGGQGQRIMLARLYYHDFPVVLIDEGTSAVDAVSEQVIYQALDDLARSGSCVITIAHRRAAVEIADEVLVMDQGRLAVAGPRQEIVSSKLFADIFSLEAESENKK